MTLDPYYSEDELRSLGARDVGRDTRVSRLAHFYAFTGSIGSRTRIDDHAIIKGDVQLGRFVHISAFCIIGGAGDTVIMRDFSGVSTHCAVFTATDDYRASALTNPTVPSDMAVIVRGPVEVGFGVVVGAHSMILPNVVIGDGASIGGHALVMRNVEPGSICVPRSGALRITGHRDVDEIRRRGAEVLAAIGES